MLITNPINGEKLNMGPLFQLMADKALSPSGTENVTQRIQNVHDFLSTHVPVFDNEDIDAQNWARQNFTLIELRNTFRKMRVDQSDEEAQPTE